ncbi:MAG: hypothetical protein RLZZ244_2431, partial [Verrucomicrobiota bacterium]
MPKYPLPALDRKRLAASFFRAFSLLALVGLLPLEAKQASAQDLSWNPSLSSGSMLGGSGTWSSTGVTNWWNGATNQTWTNGGTARFTGMGGSVNVSSGISVGAMWFNALGSGYTLMGSSLALSGGGGSQVSVQTVSDATIMVPLTGSAGLSKSGTGTLMVTLAGSYLGGTSINAGTVIYTQGGLPGTGAVAVGSGGNLQFNIVSAGANVPLTQSISLSGTLVKQGSGKLSLNTQPTGSGNVEVKGGTLTVAGTGGLLGMNGYWVEPGATLEMNTPNAGMVSTMEVGMLSGSGILSKVGSGTLALSGVSSFSGALKVGGGVLTVGSNTFNSVSSAQILAGGTVMAKDFAYDDYWEGVTVAVGGSITTNNGRRINWGKYRWSVGGSGMWDGAANSWVDDNQVAQNWNSVGYTGVPVSFPDSAGAARTVTVQSGAGMAFSVRGLHFGYGPNGSNYTLAGGSLRLVGGGEVRIDTDFGVYAQISSALLGENQGGGYFSVRKVGSGTAVLAGPSQGINRAQVNAGTLKFANSADLTHDFEVQGGAVLEVERFGPDSIQDAYFLAAGSGTLVKSGSGTLKLEGSAGFTGQVRVIGGTLFFPNIGTPLLSGSSGQVVVQSGAVLQVNTAMTAMTL